MNLFRSEEHVRQWSLYFREADDYVMPVWRWAHVFAASVFRRRLDPDYLSHSAEYLEDYRVELVRAGKSPPAADRVLTTVLFTDIVESTRQAVSLGDTEWRSTLDRHNETVRRELEHYGGREHKQTGDGFLASFASPTRAIRCAIAICRAAPEVGVRVRAGLHSGECEVLGDDLGGIAVHIASRVTATAGPGQVLASQTVKDAVMGSGIGFEVAGEHGLEGVPGRWVLYAVAD